MSSHSQNAPLQLGIFIHYHRSKPMYESDFNKYTINKNVTRDCFYDQSSQWKLFSADA